jgi:hypothetical protein
MIIIQNIHLTFGMTAITNELLEPGMLNFIYKDIDHERLHKLFHIKFVC